MGVDPYLIAPTLALRCQLSVWFQEYILLHVLRYQLMILRQHRHPFKDLPERYRSKHIQSLCMRCDQQQHLLQSKETCSYFFEMFTVDKALQVILKNPNEPEICSKSRYQKGMITLKEDALLKALKGGTDSRSILV